MRIKINSVPRRIDPELDKIIEEIMVKNELNRRQASREAAKLLKNIKIKRKEIEF